MFLHSNKLRRVEAVRFMAPKYERNIGVPEKFERNFQIEEGVPKYITKPAI
jgi:hypothetical protein